MFAERIIKRLIIDHSSIRCSTRCYRPLCYRYRPLILWHAAAAASRASTREEVKFCSFSRSGRIYLCKVQRIPNQVSGGHLFLIVILAYSIRTIFDNMNMLPETKFFRSEMYISSHRACTYDPHKVYYAEPDQIAVLILRVDKLMLPFGRGSRVLLDS